MQSYEELGLGRASMEPVRTIVDRHVGSGPARAFLTGLLTLTIEEGTGWYTRKQIGGAVGLDPERCTSNVWVTNKVLFEQFDTHRNRMSEGFGGRLLALGHRGSNPNEYSLGLIEAENGEVPFRLDGAVLRYRLADEPPRLSWIGKLHHPGVGTSREAYRKWMFLIPFFAALALAAIVFCALALVSLIPLLGAPIVWSNYVSIGGFGALVVWGIWKRWGRLFDDRILLLDSNDVTASQNGVVLDRERVGDRSFMVLRRYIAPCPICGTATVGLARGEPDHKRRIVGRCEESPREHVYSFDRVTLEGVPLGQRLA